MSFKNPTGQERYSESFPDGHYAIAANRNLVFTFQIAPREVLGSSELSKSADARFCQYVRVEIFWKPRPGTTYADSSQTNANITYCLISGKDSITYEGAGFAYMSKSWDGKAVTGQIESSTLVPAHVIGDPTDLFGPCHLKGSFTARENKLAVTTIEQKISRCRTTAAARLTNP
ncbi:MAG: hypothetical protein HZA51_15665 [Planctomycetes bacterium]|nr:hypothetical protein [Planctomycetota bacterium]